MDGREPLRFYRGLTWVCLRPPLSVLSAVFSGGSEAEPGFRRGSSQRKFSVSPDTFPETSMSVCTQKCVTTKFGTVAFTIS